MLDETRTALRSQARQGTDRTAGALDNLSSQFRALASGDPEGAGELGRYADRASEQLHAAAERIGSKGFDGLVDDVQSFARRRPGMFLAAAAASGFAVGRLFRGAQAAASESSAGDGEVAGRAVAARAGGRPAARAGGRHHHGTRPVRRSHRGPSPGVRPAARRARDRAMTAGTQGPDYPAYGEQQPAEPSLGELFGRLSSDLGELMRSEIELARVEIREETGKAGKAAGMLGAGGLIAYLGLALVATAAAWGLAEVMDAGWAFLVVGLVVGAIGAVLVAMGRQRLSEVRPVPEETVETLKEDARWARAQVK